MSAAVEAAPPQATQKPATSLTQEQIDSFWQNGFLRIGAILKDDEIDVLRREYDRVFEAAEASGGARNLSTGSKQKTETNQRMLQIINMFERSTHFHRLVYDTRILDLVQDLIGPNIMLFHDQALNKPAHTGGPVFWHQDNAYWKCRPATLVSCWLTLDDVDVHNGAMQVIPKSHLQPIWHGNTDATDALIVAGAIDATQATVVNLPAGGIMFHHCQTLHYTAPNTTDRQRRAFAIHFMNPGTRGKEGNVIGVDFNHPVLRMRI